MKLRVTMKSPDALTDAIRDAIRQYHGEADDGEREQIFDEAYEAASPWFQYGEYLTVEIDTDTGSAHIIRR